VRYAWANPRSEWVAHAPKLRLAPENPLWLGLPAGVFRHRAGSAYGWNYLTALTKAVVCPGASVTSSTGLAVNQTVGGEQAVLNLGRSKCVPAGLSISC
jgi:hypothetical protein